MCAHMQNFKFGEKLFAQPSNVFFSSLLSRLKYLNVSILKHKMRQIRLLPFFFYTAFNPSPKMAIGDPGGFTPPSHKSSAWNWQPGQAGPEMDEDKEFQ